MTAENASQLVAASGAGIAGAAFALPNPIAAALYALGSAIVGWLVAWLLNKLKQRLGL